MGRVYRLVEIVADGRKEIAIALLDTGADETVMSEKLARKLGSKLYGTYQARCASQTILTGKYADIVIKELRSLKSAKLEVGVSDIPFDTDDIDDEGIDVILGIDFVQETDFVIKND